MYPLPAGESSNLPSRRYIEVDHASMRVLECKGGNISHRFPLCTPNSHGCVIDLYIPSSYAGSLFFGLIADHLSSLSVV